MKRFLTITLVAMLALSSASAAERAVRLPAPQLDVMDKTARNVAVFAGGCFWGMEAVFEAVKGVSSVTSGYAGGSAATATYDQVSSERTRHAEAVKIIYDPRVVSYGRLLQIYFGAAHDPTQLNRQTPDEGLSYRSAVFPQSPAQKQVVESYIAQLAKARAFAAPIVTKLESGKFYAAEEYHQNFMRKNPAHPYIVRWDKPKLANFRATYPAFAR